MKELGKLLLVKQIYKDFKQIPMQSNPVLLVIAYFDGEASAMRHFYFDFTHESEVPRTCPLLLGTQNGSCGEYKTTHPEELPTFKELGCLTDALGCMMAIHLVKELRANGHADVSHVHHVAIALMSYLVQRYRTFLRQNERGVKGGIPPYRLRKIEEYVVAQISEPIQVAQLAAIAGTSQFHFSRMFKQLTGETPYQFIARQKINEAKRLLLETDMKITTISFRVGFCDPGHFARVFKKQLGITPTEFRRILVSDARF
ncbi:MAG: AraC family transcriptional regulator [Bacteroidota bacterium]